MNEQIVPNVAGTLTDLSARLQTMEEQLSAITQKLQISEEIQVETVQFFVNLHQEQRQGFASLQEQVRATADQFGEVTVNTMTELNQSLQTVLRDFGTLLARTGNGLHSQIHHVKQTANLVLRNIPSRQERIRCLFLVQSVTMWDAFADVYARMVEEPLFDPIVCSLNVSQLGSANFTGEADVSEFLKSQGIPHLRFGMDDSFEALDIMKSLQPDVIFRQQFWEGGVQPGFQTGEITFARLCLIPYAALIIQTHDDGPQGSDLYSPAWYDQFFHRMTWRIFCENTEMRETFLKPRRHDASKIVVSGYPKFERLLKAKGQGQWPIPERGERAYRVVWAPHHSVRGGLGFGVFDRMAMDMLAWARSQPDIEFVLKPHPALTEGLVRAKVMTEEQARDYFKAWSALPNCTICDGLYGELFDASDLMITDGISFLTEYPLFDKPLVYFESGCHVPFNALGHKANAASHVVRDFASLKSAVLSYKGGAPWKFETERAALKEALLPGGRSSVDVIIENIAEGIHSERQAIRSAG
ncbi:hypothetical protein ASE04_25090 [Rhizobium sp. Root708]|uniref:CDP-glycerol glycerophosphotransferase family protein n=1 Tax=Rhizobium sp. Root708 TaxID=1736592 RepID=UPI0006F7D464|nr:CDP-glycerol glycerophosphotransferase family protein [Rhizobium sp. Root708]KRB60344.1 hypothetical protein ASE04_25090 [Rhizobium sp. Root708]